MGMEIHFWDHFEQEKLCVVENIAHSVSFHIKSANITKNPGRGFEIDIEALWIIREWTTFEFLKTAEGFPDTKDGNLPLLSCIYLLWITLD